MGNLSACARMAFFLKAGAFDMRVTRGLLRERVNTMHRCTFFQGFRGKSGVFLYHPSRYLHAYTQG
jgi:hypothetical protein